MSNTLKIIGWKEKVRRIKPNGSSKKLCNLDEMQKVLIASPNTEESGTDITANTAELNYANKLLNGKQPTKV